MDEQGRVVIRQRWTRKIKSALPRTCFKSRSIISSDRVADGIKSRLFRRTRRLAFDVARHAAVFVEHLAGIAIGFAHTAAGECEQGRQHQILYADHHNHHATAKIIAVQITPRTKPRLSSFQGPF